MKPALCGQTPTASARADRSAFAAKTLASPAASAPSAFSLPTSMRSRVDCRVSAASDVTGSQLLVKEPGEELLAGILAIQRCLRRSARHGSHGSASRRSHLPGASSEPPLRPEAAHRRLDLDLHPVQREAAKGQKLAQSFAAEQPGSQRACNSGLRQLVAVVNATPSPTPSPKNHRSRRSVFTLLQHLTHRPVGLDICSRKGGSSRSCAIDEGPLAEQNLASSR